MRIDETDYSVRFDATAATIHIEGSIRLRPRDYEPLWGFLLQVLDQRPSVLTLDLNRLVFLNSSGINALYKLAVEMRARGGMQLHVRASGAPWQQKSLPNLARFLPGTIVSMSPPAAR